MSSAPHEASGEFGSSAESVLRDILEQHEVPPQERIVQLLELGASRFGGALGVLVRVGPAGDAYTIDDVSDSDSEG